MVMGDDESVDVWQAEHWTRSVSENMRTAASGSQVRSASEATGISCSDGWHVPVTTVGSAPRAVERLGCREQRRWPGHRPNASALQSAGSRPPLCPAALTG